MECVTLSPLDNASNLSASSAIPSAPEVSFAVSDPDVALMLRIKDDDAVAFEILVSRFQARIARLMMGWVHSQEIAEELVQEVFLRVFRSRKTYEPAAKFTTWIYRIANNVASNSVRDRSKRKEYQLGGHPNPSTTDIGIEHIALASSGAMPTRNVDRRERAEIVQHAVQALGERQRIALMLSRFENLSYQEIADTMGLSVKAVKSLLSRARVNLKTLLQPYMEEGTATLGTVSDAIHMSDATNISDAVHDESDIAVTQAMPIDRQETIQHPPLVDSSINSSIDTSIDSSSNLVANFAESRGPTSSNSKRSSS